MLLSFNVAGLYMSSIMVKELSFQSTVKYLSFFVVVYWSLWIPVIAHSGRDEIGDEGPLFFGALMVMGVGTLLALPAYILSVYLAIYFPVNRLLRGAAVLLLSLVIGFCSVSALLFSRGSVDGFILFLLPALGYWALTILLLMQMVCILRRRS